MQHGDQPARIANEDRIVDSEFYPQRLADFGGNIAVWWASSPNGSPGAERQQDERESG